MTKFPLNMKNLKMHLYLVLNPIRGGGGVKYDPPPVFFETFFK